MTEMVWLAFVLIASSTPEITTKDHTIIQRRLLPHCDRVCLLLRKTIPGAPCDEEKLSLDFAFCIIADLYEDQSKLKEAEDMYVRALAGAEKSLGLEHTSTLDTVNNLGVLYKNQGKMREAEEMYVRALAGYEKALGPEHTSTLRTVNNLETIYKGQCKLKEAEEIHVHTRTSRTHVSASLIYRQW